MTYPIRSIVAAIAEPDGPDPVLAAAAGLAARTGATLHVVHAFELPDPMWDAYVRMGYGNGTMLRQYTERLRARLRAQAENLGIAQSERVKYHTIAGAAAPMVKALARQEEADLILVGATRRGTLARTILGTTAQRVLRGAPAPVLVLRDALQPRLRRVLLTTDLSPFSANIHEVGLDVLEAVFRGDEPEVRSLYVAWYGAEFPLPQSGGQFKDRVLRELEAFLRDRGDRARSVAGNVAGTVRFGDPSNEIVAEAADWGADLLVVGTHGRSGPERWLLGSVAEATVRNAQSNVLVIPARIHEQNLLPVRPDQTEDLVTAGT